MSFIPLIGVAIASAATAGIAAKIITENANKKLRCPEDTVEIGGQCISCIGGSSTTYINGVTANVQGCRCPDGTGWDAPTSRCVRCPAGLQTGMLGGGGEGTIRGCGCDDDKKYNSTTKSCETCPNGTWGRVSVSETSTKGCYCSEGDVWDTANNRCKSCVESTGLTGIKNGECTSCPEHSSVFSMIGMPTDVTWCNCNNGYIYSNGNCVACPAGHNTSNGKCCPVGSGYMGSGERLSDDCYCLPYHTLTDGTCVYTQGTPYTCNLPMGMSASGTPSDEPTSVTLTQETIPATIPATAIGISKISVIVLMTNKVPGIFVKNITLEYTVTGDATIKTYTLENARDLYADNIDALIAQAADTVNPEWIIKRITMNVLTETSGYIFDAPVIMLGFIGDFDPDTNNPRYMKVFYFTLSIVGSNRSIAMNLVA